MRWRADHAGPRWQRFDRGLGRKRLEPFPAAAVLGFERKRLRQIVDRGPPRVIAAAEIALPEETAAASSARKVFRLSSVEAPGSTITT
jgi:hypothetical protein